MSQQFKIGDKVLVVIGEGLDTPFEAQGKTGTIVGNIGESEYWVEMPDGLKFSAAFYHILSIPHIVQFNDARNIVRIIKENDPDLLERLEKAHEDPVFTKFNLPTVAMVAMWLGCDAIIAGTHGLRECDIFER